MKLSTFKITSFSATDNCDLCSEFYLKHKQSLIHINVPNVTSLNRDWFSNDECYVTIIEDVNTKKMIGGIRLEVKTHTHPLPIEKALPNSLDNYLVSNVFSNKKLAEHTALWLDNSYKGFGLVDVLMLCNMSVANSINVDSMFALCSEHTQKTAINMGFKLQTQMGENGIFRYPTPDFRSFLYIQHDFQLNNVDREYRDKILFLSEVNSFETIETYKEYRHKISYNFSIRQCLKEKI